MSRGGKRAGSGRKATGRSGKALIGTSIQLDETDLELLAAYRKIDGQARTVSEAVRTCIRSWTTQQLGLNYSNLEMPSKPEERIDF